jgi:hypothetical protein
MHRLNELGRKFEGTGSYELANCDHPNLLVYKHDKAFGKYQVYKAIIALADGHHYDKDKVISFLLDFQNQE